MRILIIANKGSNHAKKVAEGLVCRGHQVILASPNDSIDNSVPLDDRIILETMPFSGNIGYLTNVFSLRSIYKKYAPDVVNVHYASGCGFLAMLAGVKPMVLSCYGSDIFEFPHISIIHKWLLKCVLKKTQVLLSTSNAMASEIRNVLNNPSKQILITPFGINTSIFKPSEVKIKNDRPVIGIVKTLSPIYDIELLIKAFQIIHEEAEEMEELPILKIYGDGPLRKHLVQLSVDLGIANDVEFCGRIRNDKVPIALGEMDVFVNCSKQESFGVNILEAMACGIPVIATDCVGPKEIMEDGVTGIILKERTPECLAKTIIWLLKNEEVRNKFGKASRKRVCEKYDWSKNILTIESILESNHKT